MSQWKTSELAMLRGLRERFLKDCAQGADYWAGEEELALYDATFGERIGWKWDAVLGELSARGWAPRSKRVVDWGCGSGIAGRRVLARWPGFESLVLHDRSARAMRFATERARSAFPQMDVQTGTPDSTGSLLVISHVLNELSGAGLAALLAQVRTAREVLWVEAGTRVGSRRLIEEVREVLRGEFLVVAPCPHQGHCGLLKAENERHWCHHFAEPPRAIFQDAKWVEFGRDLHIDLRSLPYSFLVLERAGDARERPAGLARVIGRPREAKGHCKILSCEEAGVGERMLQKRDDGELFRAFHKGTAGSLYRWETTDGRITGAERFA